MKKYIILLLFILMNIKTICGQGVLIQDSIALVDLYYSADGINWQYNYNWLITPVNDWYGIIVTSNRVTHFSSSLNNLNGFLPSSFGNLTQLHDLVLSGNSLTGPIPESIGNLVNLHLIDLMNNQFTSIPDSIDGCINAIWLFLHNNQLTGPIPASMGNLVNLEYLLLADNQLTGEIPATLGNLISLKICGLQNNQLTGTIPAELCNLSVNLETLELSYNQLSGPIPEYIGNLTNIWHLILAHNNFSKNIPDTISDFQNLRSIDLSYNNLTGEIPQNLGAGNYIYPYPRFYFNNNHLSGQVPVSLSNYPYFILYIQNNHFSEMPDFSSMQYKPVIYMQNNNFTFEDIEPNINLDTIFYIPQDSVLSADTLTAVVDSPFVISSKIGGTVNHYQWYKNGDSIAGATDSILYFPTVAWSDSGFYTCRITNDIVTDLTLWRHTVTLWVTDTLTGVRPKPQDQSPKSQDLSPKFQIPIWPNPAKRGETITITCQSYNSAGAEATVYNILCTKVYKTTAPAGKGKITINTDNLQAGVYTVVLKMADKTGYGKVVVY